MHVMGESAASRNRVQHSDGSQHAAFAPRRVANMSDIQQFLLDYDRNRKEATATAQRSAARMYGLWRGRWAAG